MLTQEFWSKLALSLELPFEVEDVIEIESNAGSTWIEVADGSSFYIIIDQCDDGENQKEDESED
jgi:hypothetical protein